MKELSSMLQNADWKLEKHVPVIEFEGKFKSGENMKVAVSVGKKIQHPNTTEHHIMWVKLYFLAEGEKFPVEIGSSFFSAHGASAQGPNTGGVYTASTVTMEFKSEKKGTLFAESFCNIHGLWQSSLEV